MTERNHGLELKCLEVLKNRMTCNNNNLNDGLDYTYKMLENKVEDKKELKVAITNLYMSMRG